MTFAEVSSDRVVLGPPSDDDLTWILEHLSDPDIARALGWEDRPGAEVYSGYIEDTALLMPFRDAAGRRVGFIMLVRPDRETRTWTVNIAVPHAALRNGFTALAALDALCHLVFDVREDAGLAWMIAPDNLASKVLPKRLGYPKLDDVVQDGVTFERYGIDRSAWQARQARVARKGRKLEYSVRTVGLEDVAHGAVIRAVRRSFA